MRRWLWLLLLLALALVAGCGRRNAPDPTESEDRGGVLVSLAAVRLGVMTKEIEVAGTIEMSGDVSISSQATGRVARVTADEGDHVHAGQVLVQLDPSESQAQLRQALAAQSVARARLTQAKTAEQDTPEQVLAAERSAQAALTAAQDQLRILQQGARTQERQVANNTVRQAEAAYRDAKANHERMQQLYSQKAISKQMLDSTETQMEMSEAALHSAQEQLNLMEEGARPEQIEVAQAQVRQAEEALRLARLNRSQIKMRKQDVQSARASLAQATAVVSYARDQLSKTQLRSPINGVVYWRGVEPGETVTGMSNTPLLKLADLRTVYYRTPVSELEIEQVKVGQPVAVTVDALRGRTPRGMVATLIPVAAQGSRSFEVKIAVRNPTEEILPGMFARGKIEVARHRQVVVVPKEALVERNGRPAVFVVEGNRARLRLVETGLSNGVGVEIRSGLVRGEQVIVKGQESLEDGDQVQVGGRQPGKAS